MAYYLGLDSSTQSLSAVVIDSQSGAVVLDTSIQYGTDLPDYKSPNGFLENDDLLAVLLFDLQRSQAHADALFAEAKHPANTHDDALDAVEFVKDQVFDVADNLILAVVYLGANKEIARQLLRLGLLLEEDAFRNGRLGRLRDRRNGAEHDD